MRRPLRSPCPPVLSVLLALAFGARNAVAQMPFAPFAARQAALGGASIALGGDPTAFADNPALLNPAGQSAGVSLGYSAAGSGDYVPLLKGVTGKDPAELAQPGSTDAGPVRANLAALAAPGSALLGDGRYGILGTASGWGISVLTTSWTASFLRADLVHVGPGNDPATSFLYNDSRVAFRALSMEDYAVTRVIPLYQGVVLGVTGHFLRGTASIKEEGAFATSVSRLDTFVRRGTGGGIDRTRSRFSYDVGLAVKLGAVELGGVMKGVNRPTFPFDDESAPAADRGAAVTVGRQTRVGASLAVPGTALLIAADLDLSKNDTLVDGLASRGVGGGLELGIGSFVVRGGASANLEAPGRPIVISSGLGYGSATFKVDVAVTYRSNDGALGGILSARIGL